eukprot:CAMPEP_0174896110 /NCGR_PEP_ID=MMETSP0167-20121228/10356_1 /TAXON_ID=38298 /ORGANISM="Rhodella maculata, Strain CCMP736" /LENGTH=63 /DNA_ID=CAMNT_0016135591 /DNA_START=385 /DNA_END=576 /DNA_ORIENTATION=-
MAVVTALYEDPERIKSWATLGSHVVCFEVCFGRDYAGGGVGGDNGGKLGGRGGHCEVMEADEK